MDFLEDKVNSNTELQSAATNPLFMQADTFQLEDGQGEVAQKPSDMIEVFIGGLSKGIKEEVILSAVNDIVSPDVTFVRVARRKKSGECRGWATVRVPNLPSAQKLCEQLKYVGGKQVGVHISRGKPLGPEGFPYYPGELYQQLEPPDTGDLRKVFDRIRGNVDKQGLLMSTIRGVFYPRAYWDKGEVAIASNACNGGQQGKDNKSGKLQLSSGQGSSQDAPPTKKRKKEEVQVSSVDTVIQKDCPGCNGLINKFRAQPNGVSKTALALLHEYASRLGMEVMYEEQVDDSTGLFKCCARLCQNSDVSILYAQGTGTGRSKKDAKQIAAAFIIESLLKKVPEQDFMCSFRRDKKKLGNPRAGIGTRTQRFRQVNTPNTSAVAAKSAMMLARKQANTQQTQYAVNVLAGGRGGQGQGQGRYQQTQQLHQQQYIQQHQPQYFQKGGDLKDVNVNVNASVQQQQQYYYQGQSYTPTQGQGQGQGQSQSQVLGQNQGQEYFSSQSAYYQPYYSNNAYYQNADYSNYDTPAQNESAALTTTQTVQNSQYTNNQSYQNQVNPTPKYQYSNAQQYPFQSAGINNSTNANYNTNVSPQVVGQQLTVHQSYNVQNYQGQQQQQQQQPTYINQPQQYNRQPMQFRKPSGDLPGVQNTAPANAYGNKRTFGVMMQQDRSSWNVAVATGQDERYQQQQQQQQQQFYSQTLQTPYQGGTQSQTDANRSYGGLQGGLGKGIFFN